MPAFDPSSLELVSERTVGQESQSGYAMGTREPAFDPSKLELVGETTVPSEDEIDPSNMELVGERTVDQPEKIQEVPFIRQRPDLPWNKHKTTVYSTGPSSQIMPGPDESEDENTNNFKSSLGPNLSYGAAAVGPGIPLGSVLQNENGDVFIATDRHGNPDPNTIDIFIPPNNHQDYYSNRDRQRPMNWAIIDRVPQTSVATTPEGLQEQLSMWRGENYQPPDGYDVFRGEGIEPLGDTGQGRLSHAANRFGHSIEVSAGNAIIGLSEALDNTQNYDLLAQEQNVADELAGINAQIEELRKSKPEEKREAPIYMDQGESSVPLPYQDTVGILQERKDNLEFILQQAEFGMKSFREVGQSLVKDANERWNLNPAYKGEFWADLLPSIAGQSVESLAPAFIPYVGIPAIVANSFGQSFKQSMDSQLARGTPYGEAVGKATWVGIVNGALDVGPEMLFKSVIAQAMKQATKSQTVKAVVDSTTKATEKFMESPARKALVGFALEGGTESLQELGQQWIENPGQPLDWNEIGFQGAMGVIGKGTIVGPALSLGYARIGLEKGIGAMVKSNALKAFERTAEVEQAQPKALETQTFNPEEAIYDPQVVAEYQTEANQITKRMKGAAKVTVVPSAFGHKGIPADIRDTIKAVYDPKKKEVTVFANKMQSLQDLRETVLHEVVGHGGIGAILDSAGRRKYNSIIDGIKVPPEKIKEISETYGYNTENRRDKAMIVEEYLAQLAQKDPTQGKVKRFISGVRNILRPLFPKIKWTDADVVNLLMAARRGVEKGTLEPSSEGPLRFSKETPAWDRFARSGYSETEIRRLEEFPAEERLRKTRERVSKYIGSEKYLDAPERRMRIQITEDLQNYLKFLEAKAAPAAPAPLTPDPASYDWLFEEGAPPETVGTVAGKPIKRQPRQTESEQPPLGPPTPPPSKPSTGGSEEGKQRERGFITTVKAGNLTPQRVIANLSEWYFQLTNKKTIEAAKARIAELGSIDAAQAEILATKHPTPMTMAMAFELMERYAAEGETKDVASAILYRHIAEKGTSLGQAVQSFAIFARMTNGGIRKYAESVVDEYITNTPGGEKIRQDIDAFTQTQQTEKTNQANDAILQIKIDLDRLKLNPSQISGIQVAIRDILMHHDEKNPANTHKMLSEMFQNDAGLTQRHADSLASKLLTSYEIKLSRMRTKELRKVLKIQAEGNAKPRMNLSTVSKFERLINLNNQKPITDAELRSALFKAWKLPNVGPELINKVRGLMNEYNAATDSEVKTVIGAQMLQAIHEGVPAGGQRKVAAWLNLAMLTNFKTIDRNITGNSLVNLLELMAQHVVQMTDWGYTRTRIGLHNMFPKLNTPEAAMQRRLVGQEYGEAAKGFVSPFTDFRKGYNYGRGKGGKWVAFKRGLAQMSTMGRMTAAGTMEITDVSESYRHAFSSKPMRFVEDTLGIVLGSADRAYHQAVYKSYLARQIAADRKNGGSGEQTDEMMERAMAAANHAIFQDSNWISERLAATKRAWNGKGNKVGPGTVVLPFTQVPGSIFYRAYEFSPANTIVTAIREGLRHRKVGADRIAVMEAIARGLVGSGIAGVGYWLAKMGIITGAEEEDRDLESFRRAAGVGGLRFNASQMGRTSMNPFTKQFWEPFTNPNMKIPETLPDDQMWTYGFLMPVSLTVAAAASYAQEGDANYMRTLSNMVQDQTFFTGIARLAQNMTYYGILPGIFETALQAPSMAIPTVVAQMAQLQNNIYREQSSRAPITSYPRWEGVQGSINRAINSVVARIPGVAGMGQDALPPKYDLYGIAKERYQYDSNGIWNVMFNPSFVTRAKNDPVLREVNEMWRVYGTLEMFPGRVGRNVEVRESPFSATASGFLKQLVTPYAPDAQTKIEINGRKIELTNEQISAYQRFNGLLGYAFINELLARPAFARAPLGFKSRIFSQITKGVHAASKFLLFNDRKSEVDNENDLWFNLSKQVATESGLMDVLPNPRTGVEANEQARQIQYKAVEALGGR